MGNNYKCQYVLIHSQQSVYYCSGINNKNHAKIGLSSYYVSTVCVYYCLGINNKIMSKSGSCIFKSTVSL